MVEEKSYEEVLGGLVINSTMIILREVRAKFLSLKID
jgi:hypothetical protein